MEIYYVYVVKNLFLLYLNSILRNTNIPITTIHI